MEKKDLKTQATILINLFNSRRFEDTIQKGKILIKKFPNQYTYLKDWYEGWTVD